MWIVFGKGVNRTYKLGESGRWEILFCSPVEYMRFDTVQAALKHVETLSTGINHFVIVEVSK